MERRVNLLKNEKKNMLLFEEGYLTKKTLVANMFCNVTTSILTSVILSLAKPFINYTWPYGLYAIIVCTFCVHNLYDSYWCLTVFTDRHIQNCQLRINQSILATFTNKPVIN